MRILSLAAITAISVGATLAGSAVAVAQSSESAIHHRKVLGYQDEQTGAFHPLATAAPDITLSPTTGTVELELTTSLRTTLPKGGSVVCGASLIVLSENLTTGSLSSWTEDAYGIASVSGTTATCTILVPYSFIVPAASTTLKNTIEGTYTVEMVNATGAVPPLIVDLFGTFLSAPLPPTSTTTKVPVSATI
jgi:hypothetical protein